MAQTGQLHQQHIGRITLSRFTHNHAFNAPMLSVNTIHVIGWNSDHGVKNSRSLFARLLRG